MNQRCNECDNCKKVERCKRSLLAGLAKARTKGQHVGEDARVIWNDMLETHPCTHAERELYVSETN